MLRGASTATEWRWRQSRVTSPSARFLSPVPPNKRLKLAAAVRASSALVIERTHSAALAAPLADAVQKLCDAAYATNTAPFFESLGPGEHLLGWRDGRLVSHLMWVPRWLQPLGQRMLRTAYVEMVATAPDQQRQGHASELLTYFVSQVPDFDVGALCPATEGLYARLGWL